MWLRRLSSESTELSGEHGRSPTLAGPGQRTRPPARGPGTADPWLSAAAAAAAAAAGLMVTTRRRSGGSSLKGCRIAFIPSSYMCLSASGETVLDSLRITAVLKSVLGFFS